MDETNTKIAEKDRHDEFESDDGRSFHSLADTDLYQYLTQIADVGSFHEAIVDVTHRDDRLLDLCAGDGSNSEAAVSQTQAEYTAIEISREQIQKGRETIDGNWIEGDAERLPFPDNTFDTVIASLALHHLPNWKQDALSEVTRVLKPDGAFVFRDPLRHNPLMWTFRAIFESRDRTDAEVPLSYKELPQILDEKFVDVEIESHYIVSPALTVLSGQAPFAIPRSVLQATVRCERAILDNGGGVLGAEVIGVAHGIDRY